MASKNYVIDKEEKVIYANVASLTEKQVKAIKNYLALGYTLTEKEKTPNEKMKKENVVAYLNENGTQAQIAKFNEIMEEIVIDKETKQPKKLKDGTPKKKGYVAALQYFKKQFPDYCK